MRSSPSAPDPLAPGRLGFAHRGLHDRRSVIENSAAAFAAAVELGCGIECDLRLTADDKIVVFHDADARRLAGDPAIIAGSTLAALAHLRVGGHPVPTLRHLLAQVAGRVPLLLEAKVEGDPRRFGRALARDLAGYGGPAGVMSFHPGLPRWLKRHAPHLRRGLVIRDRLAPLRRWFAMALAQPQFLAVERAALGKPWVARARVRMPVYTWTIATADQRRDLDPLADALIWEADGRP